MKKMLVALAVAAHAANAADIIEMPAGAVSPYGIVITSSENAPNEAARNVFDGQDGTKWLAWDSTGWVVYRFEDGNQWALTNYWLQAAPDAENRDPRVWQVEGSNDLAGNTPADVLAAKWSVAHAFDNSPDWNLGDRKAWREFSCATNEVAYNAYRFNVTATAGYEYLQLGEWVLQGNSGRAQVKAGAVSGLGHDGATLHGEYEKFVGGAFDFYVACGTNDWGYAFDDWDAHGTILPEAEPAEGAFAIPLAGLDPETGYVARFCVATQGVAVAWSGPMAFTTFGHAPTITTQPASGVGGTTATLSAGLAYAGVASGSAAPGAVVTLHWGETAGDPAWDHNDVAGVLASGDFAVTNLTGLKHGTTYWFTHSADNGALAGWSPVTNQFRTHGEVVFGTPRFVALADAIVFSVAVEEAAVTPADITLWVGEDANPPQPAKTWPGETTAKTYAWTLEGAGPGVPYVFQFSGANEMPDTLLTNTVWTALLPASAGNREVTWNAGLGAPWDTTSPNWLYNGGAATFKQGDSARFWMTANSFDGDLQEDMDAASITVKSFNNTTWRAKGDTTLTIHGGAVFETNGDSPNNEIFPKLSGAGPVTLKFGGMRILNPGNDFTGGVNALNGVLRAPLDSEGATPFGAGALTLASDEVEPGQPLVVISGEGTMNVPVLKPAGRMNSGRIQLVKSVVEGVSKETAAFFGAFSRENGATFQLSATTIGDLGTYEKMVVNGLASHLVDGVLPPWAASTIDQGSYLTHDALDGLRVVTSYPASILTGAGNLADNASYTAARLTGNLDLGGFSIALGGANLRNGVTLSNGALDLGGDDAYFYVSSGAATVSTRLDGGATLVKFGAGELVLNASDNRPYVAQEGILRLATNAPTAYDYLVGSGEFGFRNHDATFNPGGVFEFNGAHLHSGSITVGAGVEVRNHGTFISAPLAQGMGDSPGSTLSILNGGYWTQTRGSAFRIGSAHIQFREAHDHDFSLDGEGSLLDMNGGLFILGGVADNNSKTYTNTVHITNGAVLTNAAGFLLAYAQGGNFGRALIDGGARVHTRGVGVGGGYENVSNGGGSYNTVRISGHGTVLDNGGGTMNAGNTAGGNSSSHNTIIVDDHAVVQNVGSLGVGQKMGQNSAGVYNNSIIITNNAGVISSALNVGVGSYGTSYDNLLDICGGGVWTSSGTQSGTFVVNFGSQGWALRNVLRVQSGGRVENLPKLTVGQANAYPAHAGCVEVLNGGQIVMKGDSGARVILGQANNASQHNPAHTNSLHIAGGPLGFSKWDFKGAHLNIGYNTSTASDRQNAAAHANWARAGTGGILTNITDIVVGAAAGNSIGNALILDGGEIYAASLAVNASNRLDAVIGADGVKPVKLSGNAVFAVGSSVKPAMAARATQAGKWHHIVETPNGAITLPPGAEPNDLLQPAPGDPMKWKLELVENNTILRLAGFNPPTLFMVR